MANEKPEERNEKGKGGKGGVTLERGKFARENQRRVSRTQKVHSSEEN
jgi:hypothetical protein